MHHQRRVEEAEVRSWAQQCRSVILSRRWRQKDLKVKAIFCYALSLRSCLKLKTTFQKKEKRREEREKRSAVKMQAHTPRWRARKAAGRRH